MCHRAGDDGRWLADDVGPAAVVGAHRRGAEVGDLEPPAGPEADPAAQRRLGQARSNVVVRLFRE